MTAGRKALGWVAVALVVVAFLGVGLVREGRRVSGLEALAGARGLALRAPFAPGDRPPVAALAARFDQHGARRWGVAVEGACDGVAVTIAEYETSRKEEPWSTLVAWPVPGEAGPVAVWRAPSTPLLSDMGVAVRLGLGGSAPADLRVTTPGGLLVEGAPAARAAFLTEARQRAFEAWPHGGELVRDGGWAAWRTCGLLTPERLEALLGQLSAARRLFE